jgi:hypothetical protein
MRAATATRNGPQPAFASAEAYDAYAKAEHMLRCYGTAYVCQHPELLFGRVPSFDVDHQHDQTRRHMPYDPAAVYARPGAARHDTGDDTLVRILRGYQMLDDIYAPNRTPARAFERTRRSNTRASTDIGGQR